MITCSKCSTKTEDHYKSDYYCKSCRKKVAKVIRDRNKEERNKKRRERLKTDPEYKKKVSMQKYNSYWNNIPARMYYSIKSRCKIRNIVFELDIQDINIPEYCPILKVKLDRDRYSPTLDRIIPELGYVKGNVRVISKKANTMKNDATLTELLNFSKNIKKYLKSFDDIVQPIEN